jgi:hypothetical protein
MNYYDGAGPVVEVSADGRQWTTLGTLDDKTRSGLYPLPASMFPAATVYTRLRHPATQGMFQINTYEFEAGLDGRPPEVTGQSSFFTITTPGTGLNVTLISMASGGSADQSRLRLAVTNNSAEPIVWRAQAEVGEHPTPTEPTQFLPPGQGVTTALPISTVNAGKQRLTVNILDPKNNHLFSAETTLQVGLLERSDFGHALKGSNDADLWWCESAWQVGQHRDVPETEVAPITVSLARREYEAFQVVLKPAKAATLKSIRLVPDGKTAPLSFSYHTVAYVPVSRPTDNTCLPGLYPDPLPMLKMPLTLEPGINHPLWITVYAPTNATSGEFRFNLEIETSESTMSAPLVVRIYDFELPAETHLRSALGLGNQDINEYHHLTRPEDQRAVYDKYLENFVAHRISPYSFFPYAPIQIRFPMVDGVKKAVVDFKEFDAAAAVWLDEKRFNSFLLPLTGMGGGTYQSRALGELEGFKEGTPEHARLFNDYLSQVEAHLRERHWLAKAYTYWFDEPEPKDYDFVLDGMHRIKTAAPGLRRMLTEQPEPELTNHVEIWCGLTPEWNKQKVEERHQAGQEVWWYICCAPRAPYVTEFIDHPSLERRLWPWQSWQYKIDGILIWQTTYWNNPQVYPAPSRQNPWADPMSYESPGGFWGNGDGRFVYPPQECLTTNTPNLDGPVTSIRWENLRDGMEDYEYFHLLNQECERLSGSPAHAQQLSQARLLLEVPTNISSNLVEFTTDPTPLLKHRERLAKSIEALSRLKP